MHFRKPSCTNIWAWSRVLALPTAWWMESGGKGPRQDGYRKLSFLPSGQHLENPVEMLSSQKMRNLLADMKQRYVTDTS
jgi:hypothetical protein